MGTQTVKERTEKGIGAQGEKINRESTQMDAKEKPVYREVRPVTVGIVSGRNPRILNDRSAAFLELVESVRAQGVRVPIHVRHLIGTGISKGGKYELLAGERRLIAAVTAKLETIPVIDHGVISDAEAFEITFVENYLREDLTPLEEGRAAQFMIVRYNGDVTAAASKLGKSERWVRQRAAIDRNLIAAWRKTANDPDNDWTASHLQAISPLPADTQKALLNDLQYRNGRSITVGELEKKIAAMLRLVGKAPWDITKPGIFTKAPACSKCLTRSSRQPELFEGATDKNAVKKTDRCLNVVCWGRKLAAYIKKQFKELKKEYPDLIPAATPGDYTRYDQDEEAKETFGSKPLDGPWRTVKEGAKGAKAVFVVFGEKAGTLMFAASASQARGNGKPTPLKTRRKLLDKKRWGKVLLDLREKLGEIETDTTKLTFEDRYIGVVMLAVMYGVDPLWSANIKSNKKGIAELIAAGDGKDQALSHLWGAVSGTLDGKLAYDGPVTQTPDSKIEWAKYVAEIVGVDIEKMFAEVAGQKGFTEPKAWAKLNADGSPKKAKNKVTTKGAKDTKEKQKATENAEKKGTKGKGGKGKK